MSDKSYRQLTLDDLYRAQIGERYWKTRIDKIPDICGYKSKLNKWVNNIHHYLDEGIGVHLYGASSSGKTAAGSILAKASLSYGYSALYITGIALRKAFSEKPKFDEFEDFPSRIKNVDLLVVDDPERGSEPIWAKAIIDEVLRYRMNKKKATIFISMGNRDDVQTWFGNDLYNVIRESTVPVEVSGYDWRKEIEEQLKKELD